MRRSCQNLQVLPRQLRIGNREEDFFRLQLRRRIAIPENLVGRNEGRAGRLLLAQSWRILLDRDHRQERKKAQGTNGRTEQ